jgi:acetamidase/formamidase
MKRTLLLSIFLPALSLAADVTGIWHLVLVRFGTEFADARVELKTDGHKLTGTLNELKLEGSTSGETLTIRATRPNGSPWGTFEGKLNGDVISGAVKQGGEEFAWRARRIPPVPTGPGQTHTFVPTKFHRVFSAAIEPVLRIQSGDTVRTWSVDAGGRDAGGKALSLGGNPQTGPFYIEGAIPGDTIAVKFSRIRLNRDTARSGNGIVPSALNPGYFRNAKFGDLDSEWKLDREGGYATLAKPTERLKGFRVKLQPMLGCVATAPSGNQAFRTGWPGSFGGNMDYNGLTEGTTVYLPVNVPGALLFVGDGHAAQGDGELTGDALETSMDIEFTVQLIRGGATAAPRMENNDWIMASGIANSLGEALQQATTEMVRWLERDYKLTPNEAAIVAGFVMKYDIAEVVDPLVHIVAKISKDSLSPLKQ